MEELAYDTLSEAKELESAGFSGRQAEAIVGTISRATAINEQMAGDLIAIRARTDAITARTDAITVQVDAITVRIDAITVQVDAITVRIDAITVQVDAITVQVDAITVRIDAIKERIDNEMVTRADLENFATKLELAELRTEMAEGFGALRAEMQECVAGLNRTIVLAMAGSFTAFAALLGALRIWG